MGRGNSSGGGQSSLGYLFGSGESPKQPTKDTEDCLNESCQTENTPKPVAVSKPADVTTQIPAGITSNLANHTGNFITDRPSTKVHAAPGGGSSLDYLFGGGVSK